MKILRHPILLTAFALTAVSSLTATAHARTPDIENQDRPLLRAPGAQDAAHSPLLAVRLIAQMAAESHGKLSARVMRTPDIENEDPVLVRTPDVENEQPSLVRTPDIENGDPIFVRTPDIENGDPIFVRTPDIENGDPILVRTPEIENGDPI